ncbi:ABC transporter [Anaerocolumna cellulosilytica]|uniref:ABC transporter n=1 Tax=Anaerocolumna cellulosilytica TaxID=433286 RepID=A0A6S6R7J0_9FIRM|nr:ABC transporter ATP-binding protein [Anaerocolumna cellulosilytica]MBB5195464.1 ATP-binding cassette subfamily B protein [Anaerocolumna cellulosilytica]BCJ95997.1 ABC transporter [Anaerocolumna cellulosilytica]
MAGPMGGKRPGAKPQNVKKTLSRIFSYMQEYKVQLILILFTIMLSAGAQVAGTSFLRKVVDGYLTPLAKEYDSMLFKGFIEVLILMGAIYVMGACSTYLYSRLMLNVSTRTLYKIRMDLFRKMESFPIKYFDTHTHGDLMSRYTNDTDTIREMLSNSVANFISSVITVSSVFIMMILFSWQLTILVVIMLFIMLNIIKKLGGKSGAYFKEQQIHLGKVNGYIEEMFEGQKVVKVFCHEDAAKEEFDKLNSQLCEAATNANTFASVLFPIMGNLSHLLYAITAIFGGILSVSGVLSIGTVVAFMQYTRSFSQPITQISQQLNSVLTALAGAERIFQMIDEEPEVDEGYVTMVNARFDATGKLVETEERTGIWAWKHPHKSDNTITYTQVKGEVEFDNVVFGYEENKTVLNGISLYAKVGQKIAFVGSTGAGKTTITNLINRFYDVPDGKIRYDGININKIKKDDLRRSLSMVLQDSHLFTGTVMDNIRYGKLDATDDEVIAAAKLANAHSFIKHLPQGYQTLLTADGANLSQGQRQLITIARAAVADPPVLILDEATSSIDTRTEALIEKGMDRLMEGRTVFVIAHRLSTVRNSHAIMVLENGRIIERGNHNQLIKQQGKYYQLYTGMFELS